MREFIHKNLKWIMVVTILVVSATVFICTDELVAKILPDISTLKVVEYKIDGQVFEYTGKEIKPEILSIVFCDEEGNKIKKQGKDITSISYIDNVDIGVADIEIHVMGYQGGLTLENAFSIQPARVESLTVKESSREVVTLSWK